QVDKTGVVYLSRVPPYMKPDKIRTLLRKYGEVNRVYLTPEDPAMRKRRVAKGGNKRLNYVDGWIEFLDKRDAKRAANELNTQAIGGKATSFYAADLWNLKYLSKFKWNHLTEKIAYDNLVRRQKLQAEISQAKKEKDFYLEKVEQSKNLKVRPAQKSTNLSKVAPHFRATCCSPASHYSQVDMAVLMLTCCWVCGTDPSTLLWERARVHQIGEPK
ncbi:hypothetical protein T484DRAFT_1613955, partial [Baffinella frigidus]